MKNIRNLSRAVWTATVLAVAAMTTQTSHATPYASSITTNAGGNISFYLNEDGGTVTVTYEDASTNASFNGITTGLSLAKGKYSFALGAHTSYSIKVFKIGLGSPSKISVDTSNTVIFASPRGVAVNSNPQERHFGLIYADNSTAGGTGFAAKSRGIYILNPDTSDAYGRSNIPSGAVFSSASSSSPYRMGIGPDNTLYVGDFSTAAATVWQFDPDVIVTNTWTNVLAIIGENAGLAAGIHGDISGKPQVTGSLATGNLVLYTDDAALGPVYNSINKYTIGAGPLPYSNAPVQLGNIGIGGVAELNTDLSLAPDGKFFGVINRNNTAYDVPSVIVFDADGVTKLWDSITGFGFALFTGPDKLLDGRSIAVSPTGKWMAVMHTDNHISVLRLTNGLPDSSSFFTIANTPTTGNGRDINWDAAENLYTVSSGQGLLRMYSLGATTTATSSNDSTGTNGTFTLTTPATQVSVTATTPFASQSGPTPGVFTLTRSSTVSADTNASLTVSFTLGGTATNGTYTVAGATTTNVTFAPGQNATNITITPVNDGLSRPTTTVILQIVGGGNYSSAPPTAATIAIQNIGPQLVFISAAPGSTMYKGLTNDYGSFVLTRWGDTNAASYAVSNFTYAGTAVSNVAYVPAQGVTFNPGDINITNITINPLVDTTNFVGNKTIIVGMSAGVGYAAGTNKVTLTIIDNVNLPATVLWSNPLTDPADAANWAVTAANNDLQNVALDYTVNFGYDLTTNNPIYTQNGLIPLPPSGATNCLRVTVNKTTGRAAGVNLYPTNVTFSGDYAVRFAMNIAEGNNAAFTTEGPLFGINHSGLMTNWQSGSTIVSLTYSNWTSDGVWYQMIADGGSAAGDYFERTGLGGTNGNAGFQTPATGLRTSFINQFKNPVPYSTLNGAIPTAGIPANSSPFNGLSLGYTNAWANVEIKTVNKLVTMTINKSTVFTFNNTTVWTNGTIMLGYDDPFSSQGGVDGAVYFSDIKVVQLAAPLITKQPTNMIVAAGTATNFSIAATFDSSSVNTNGQWLFNGTAIPGATNTTYSFTVAFTNYGTYAWQVNDGNYTVTSSNATLRPPNFSITTQPIAINVVTNGTVTNVLAIANSFSGVTNYQWLFNAVARTGITTNKYVFLANPTNYGSYTVVVNDGWNTNTSTAAVVTPPVPNIASVTPATRAAAPGTTVAAFTVTANAFSGVTNYQWLSNSVSISGATARILSLTNLQAGTFGSIYTVRVNDGTTTITSTPPNTITVAVSPVITSPALPTGSSFRLSFGTETGPNYVVDAKTNLLQATWVPVSTNAGTGGTVNVTNAISGNTGFFRIRLQ